MKDPIYCNNFYQFRILINKTYKSIVEEYQTKILSLKYQVMILLLLNTFLAHVYTNYLPMIPQMWVGEVT